MRITFAVCDDLDEERWAMVQAIQSYGHRKEIEVRVEAFASGEELIGLWRPHRWDVALLDIYMGKLSGVETARWLRKQDRDCALIFVTTSREHGMVGYELGVMDYLTKPFSQGDVDAALDWVVQERQGDLRTLSLRAEWEEREVRLRDVRFLEVRNHTVMLHMEEEMVTTRCGLEELIQKIGDEKRFYRCHRSYLVNLDHVDSIQQRDFLMDDGSLVPISGQNLAQAKRVLLEWDLAKNWGR